MGYSLYFCKLFYAELVCQAPCTRLSGRVLTSERFESPETELIPIDCSVFLPTKEVSFAPLLTAYLELNVHAGTMYIIFCRYINCCWHHLDIVG